jgi:hypothetical protein
MRSNSIPVVVPFPSPVSSTSHPFCIHARLKGVRTPFESAHQSQDLIGRIVALWKAFSR